MIPLLFDQHLCIGWSVYNALVLSAYRTAQIKRLILDVNLKTLVRTSATEPGIKDYQTLQYKIPSSALKSSKETVLGS